MTTNPTTYITPMVTAYVGTESPPLVSPPVSESEIRRFAMAAYWPEVPPRRFWDMEYAKTSRWGGIVAPDEFNPFGWMVGRAHIGPQPKHLNEEQGRLEESRNLRPPGAPARYLYAGSSSEYFAPIRPGDVITSVLKLFEVYERSGRLGLMLFYVVEERMT
ncbi:MAG: MaoC family dehydratase N-terminal domain-containing protein, partial [Chloroflexi bacterium]|nr:MaoC family dehydratase N-terminal domain-containing protein [Chloroflexota bacterium]